MQDNIIEISIKFHPDLTDDEISKMLRQIEHMIYSDFEKVLEVNFER